MTVLDPLQSLTFPLRRCSLAFILARLPVIGRLLAVVGDTVALVGYAFPFLSDPLASGEFALAPHETPLALIQSGRAPSVVTLVSGHCSTLTSQRSR